MLSYLGESSRFKFIALMETLVVEVGESGIRLNCSGPGRVRGERVENVFRAKAESLGLTYDDVMASISMDPSLKRLAEPSEVAEAAVFLTSNESSATTGNALVVSCGKHMLH